jgi:hypothetical protein
VMVTTLILSLQLTGNYNPLDFLAFVSTCNGKRILVSECGVWRWTGGLDESSAVQQNRFTIQTARDEPHFLHSK